MHPSGLNRLVLLSGFILMGLVGCQRSSQGVAPGLAAKPPSQVNLKRNVALAQASRQALEYFVETVGVLEAEAETQLAAGVTGIVDEVNFREGDEVTTDTILIRVDQKRYLMAAEQARANVERAQAALALAQDAAERTREARRGASEEERTRALLNLRVAESELRAAQAALQLAEHYLNRSQVRPPYMGRINKRLITPGSYVDEKTVIATLADLSRLRLVGYVPESAAATVRAKLLRRERLVLSNLTLIFGTTMIDPSVGMPAAITQSAVMEGMMDARDVDFTVRALPNRQFSGRIFYMSTVANPETHMFECKAEVPSVVNGTRLQPGYSATIRYPLRTNPDACVIPEEAVRPTERGFVVFVPVERRTRRGDTEWVAEARVLILGYRAKGMVEVRGGLDPQKSLRPGDWFVHQGAEALEDGTPIQFKETIVKQEADSDPTPVAQP